jgi:hypothetical protein
MILSEQEIKILEAVLKECCNENHCTTRDDIYRTFFPFSCSEIQKYKFNNELSRLIKENIITGYEIKQGRKGGIIKTDTLEQVTVTCISGNYSGYLPKSKLLNFLKLLKADNITNK